MSYSRSPEMKSAAGLVALLCCLFVAEAADAQTRVGRQWVTSGLSMTPTLVVDRTADQVGVPNTAVAGGMRLRLGFQHVVSRQLVMAAEAELGQSYFRPTTISPDGRAPASTQFAWQGGIIGRWVPRGDVSGPALGFGLHMFRSALPEAAVQALSGDVRFGWYLWQLENFALLEFGYAVPFLEGIDAPETFGAEGPAFAEQNWTMHRFVLGFSYGF